MSYLGSKFPEGVDPTQYIEIRGPEEINCPNFRRVVTQALNATDTSRFHCDGCQTPEALIIVVKPETERLFVRRDSNCAVGPVVDPPRKRTPPSSSA